jgi:hypothetical protein
MWTLIFSIEFNRGIVLKNAAKIQGKFEVGREMLFSRPSRREKRKRNG